MKKISLKTIRKSFNINKGKEEGEFVVVQQPALATDFTKEDSLFGGCYSKELGSCDLNGEEERATRTGQE
uniref:Uncharacterized protein n=1 Tax=Anguilla anguilla TaxID=7936 RepID=A0A0E9QSP8_ANGAN